MPQAGATFVRRIQLDALCGIVLAAGAWGGAVQARQNVETIGQFTLSGKLEMTDPQKGSSGRYYYHTWLTHLTQGSFTALQLKGAPPRERILLSPNEAATDVDLFAYWVGPQTEVTIRGYFDHTAGVFGGPTFVMQKAWIRGIEIDRGMMDTIANNPSRLASSSITNVWDYANHAQVKLPSALNQPYLVEGMLAVIGGSTGGGPEQLFLIDPIGHSVKPVAQGSPLPKRVKM
jgi:hypothetical protein